MPQSPAPQDSLQPSPGVKGGAIQQCAIVVVADKVTVLDRAGTVRWLQQGAHLHSVCLVPHIQQDHIEVQGGIRGNEPRCEGPAATVMFGAAPPDPSPCHSPWGPRTPSSPHVVSKVVGRMDT